MQFLIAITISLPTELPEARRRELLDAELVRGRELREQGTIVSIWRVPGGLRNVGIWEADDATELHAAISSLPLHPYMDVSVTPLARHPLDEV